ncbi:MAG TPA: pantoate--beta-alanine ligase [Bryobacteraceae bacterium]|nr:pantoate--beta-alanine ligase [Bryobacteraceae bacterium]
MHVSNTLTEWQQRRGGLEGRSIGFVPTMGALHEGHATLVRRCRAENDCVVVSLFVNPTQFNDPGDLAKYPRTLESDLAILRELGTDEVLVPTMDAMYPNGYQFKVTAPELTNLMEGAFRPGFFEGVMTVVLKLFNLVRAGRAYFGEKDYQQMKIVTAMAADLFIPTRIIPCPTVRESSGLAMSSRNVRLSPEGREKAALISKALRDTNAQAALEQAGFTVDYVEEHWGRRLAAVFLEGVRLIDNVPVTPLEEGESHAPLS